MIYARNKAALSYLGIHPNLDEALRRITPEFLASVGYETQELQGRDLYVTRFSYDTLPPEETFYEAHLNYLDIHIMTRGSERVDIAPPEDLELTESKPENDFYAYRGQARYQLTLSPGDFLVVFPDDAHRIKMAVEGPESVTKVVFKVRVR